MAVSSRLSDDVKAAFAAYPKPMRAALLDLRSFIVATARSTTGVGELVESLKWGQPAYRPARPGTGTTVRIDAIKGEPGRYAVYFHCQTTLLSTFRALYGDVLTLEGDRAIVLALDEAFPRGPLGHCIALAFTYRRADAI